jgi:hypothetical protein
VKQTYRVLSALIALGVLVQAASVAFGWFAVINDLDSGVVVDANYEGNAGHMIHGLVGMYVLPLLGLLLLVVSFFAARSVPGARTWAGILFGLIVLQVVLAFVAFGAPIVGALHGLTALAIFAVAGRAGMLSREAAGVHRERRDGAVDVPRQATGPSTPTETTRPV